MYMIKVLIVDDHAIVRTGLKQIISEIPDITVTDEAGSAREALDKIRNNNYSVLILDIALPDKSGLDALKEIKDEYPELPVLMLSMYPEDQYAIRVLKSGASGYMTKESAPGELVSAIRTVANGKNMSALLAQNWPSILILMEKRNSHEMSQTGSSGIMYDRQAKQRAKLPMNCL
jgi:DNA-binding NarL/FixJ family response regulator